MDCTYKTNKYKIPLLVIIGSTSLNSNFYIAFAFIEKEEEEDFMWVFEQLKLLYRTLGLKDLGIIMTDRDLTLMNAIAAQYPSVFHLLYIWHINKNVLKNCKPAFATEEDWEEFLGAWYRVVYAPTRVANRAA